MYINSKQRKEILTRFGTHLLYLRQQSGLSQEQAGQLLSMPASAISRYEYGGSNPTLITLTKFANVYNVNVSEILQGV